MIKTLRAFVQTWLLTHCSWESKPIEAGEGCKIGKNYARKFWAAVAAISIAGIALRFMGFHFKGVDYEECLAAWFGQMKDIGNISALAAYEGNYNYPYATVLLLTFVPVSSLYSRNHRRMQLEQWI